MIPLSLAIALRRRAEPRGDADQGVARLDLVGPRGARVGAAVAGGAAVGRRAGARDVGRRRRSAVGGRRSAAARWPRRRRGAGGARRRPAAGGDAAAGRAAAAAGEPGEDDAANATASRATRTRLAGRPVRAQRRHGDRDAGRGRGRPGVVRASGARQRRRPVVGRSAARRGAASNVAHVACRRSGTGGAASRRRAAPAARRRAQRCSRRPSSCASAPSAASRYGQIAGHRAGSARPAGRGRRRGRARQGRPRSWRKDSRRPASAATRVAVASGARRKRKNPGDDLFSRKAALSVSSALESLTSVFGMGTGVASPLESPGSSRLDRFGSGSTRGRDDRAGAGMDLRSSSSQSMDLITILPATDPWSVAEEVKPSTVSTAQLHPSPDFHMRPIKQVVSLRSYPVDPVGNLISRRASHLDAFSAYPDRT